MHRFPGNMARRVQELCATLVDEYGGRAERVWGEAADGDDLRARIGALPGFGEMKTTSLGAVLAKRFGVKAARVARPEPPDARRRRLAGGARALSGSKARAQGEDARSGQA